MGAVPMSSRSSSSQGLFVSPKSILVHKAHDASTSTPEIGHTQTDRLQDIPTGFPPLDQDRRSIQSPLTRRRTSSHLRFALSERIYEPAMPYLGQHYRLRLTSALNTRILPTLSYQDLTAAPSAIQHGHVSDLHTEDLAELRCKLFLRALTPCRARTTEPASYYHKTIPLWRTDPANTAKMTKRSTTAEEK